MDIQSRWHVTGLIPAGIRDAIFALMGQGLAAPIRDGWELRVPVGLSGRSARLVVADLMNAERARVCLVWSKEAARA